MAHVAQWKHKEVEELTNLINSNKVIGIVGIGGIPAPQMQHMRGNLHGNAVVRAAKNSLIFRAIDNSEKGKTGISGLKETASGQTAIIATDMNPFRLYRQIKATRTNAPAKGGETANHDIEIKAGETSFKPGPIVGELQKVGIPAAIESGKVIIKTDKVIVPKGEKISRDVAQMLTRLGILPLEIGMSLHSIYEEGTIFKPEVLDIDSDKFMNNLRLASSHAFNLAIKAAWTNEQTIKVLIQKAHNDAFALAIQQGIINKETVKQIVGKAQRSMLSLASKLKDGLDEDLKKMIS